MPYFKNPISGEIVEADLAPVEVKGTVYLLDGNPILEENIQAAYEAGFAIESRPSGVTPWKEATTEDFNDSREKLRKKILDKRLKRG